MAIPFEKPGPCSAIEGGRVSEGSSSGKIAETKVQAGVGAGRKGGRSWSSVEVAIGGVMVALARREWGGVEQEGWSPCLRIFMKMSPKSLIFRH